MSRRVYGENEVDCLGDRGHRVGKRNMSEVYREGLTLGAGKLLPR